MQIIAEIGVNWDGDFELLEEMMQQAKLAGCDLVKFQAFTKEMIKDHPESERLEKSSISKENVQRIDKLSNQIGIEWFCTPMYSEAVDFLNPYVKRFKIREVDARPLLENQTTELFEKLLKTGKEIIISSEKSPRNCKYFGLKNLKWLYCVPKYPCNVTDFDFTKINDFDGFSNHSNEMIVPIISAVLGGKIIEVHVTIDKRKKFFDNNVSFNFLELKEIIKNVHISDQIKKINI